MLGHAPCHPPQTVGFTVPSQIAGMSLPQLLTLAVVSLLLLAWSLQDLHRRPAARVLGGNKWVWLVVIVVLGLPAQLVYLLLGRRRG